jgi:hypothetical protein
MMRADAPISPITIVPPPRKSAPVAVKILKCIAVME